jgi:hypothetical protein
LVVILVCEVVVIEVLFCEPRMPAHRHCKRRRVVDVDRISRVPKNEVLAKSELQAKSYWILSIVRVVLSPESTPESLSVLIVIRIECDCGREGSEVSVSSVEGVVERDSHIICHSVLRAVVCDADFFSLEHPSMRDHIRPSAYHSLSISICILS